MQSNLVISKIQKNIPCQFVVKIFSLCMIGFLFGRCSQTSHDLQLKTENGIIEGIQDNKTSVKMYLGIPFAKPPVGELRWKEPQPMDNWQGVKETKKFGHRPVQINVWGDMDYRSDTTSEDCLYLNVWTTAKSNEKRPVLVYFYGGGCVCGDGSEPRYDGASMSQKGIVAVTVNYRLNIFGFFAHPELSAESPYKASGNYGFLDQNMALKWVQKNIAAFGGDPQRITIAGESAGSSSVCAQVISPLSRNLFAQAIGESGSMVEITEPLIPLQEAEKTGLEFAKNAGYASLADLRKLSTEQIFAAYQKSGRFGFPTVLDGYFFPRKLTESYKAGEFNKVPLLLGWNSAEVPGSSMMNGLPYTEDNYRKIVQRMYPEDYQEILKLYPSSNPKEMNYSATALASDNFIAYSTWKWFDMHRKYSNQPVYRYLFSKVRPPLVDQSLTAGLAGGTMKKEDAKPESDHPIGAPHASEIPYCMGNLPLVKVFGWTDEDYKASEAMQSYFANFIISGNPNGNNLPEWTAALPGESKPPVMEMNVIPKMFQTDDARYHLLDRISRNDN
jgi:para-nitrobenzyl esterase